ncbi:MAG TPA: ABC transporter substrate-binding protein [Candidatus Binatia bacterium]|jgi:ABC-type nitrate/sulfonate/bicarbonate transport system substrate-binding protein|nr:ABC transporter substrate-binding protein [Candidatus Binatia bacterium]
MLINKLRVVALVYLCASLVTGKVTRDARAEEKVRFSVAAVTGSYMDEFVAIEKGYHREEGLTVQMIRAGGGIATQALMAGDLHFSTSAGSALSAMLRGAEIKVVYTNIDRPGYQVWSGRPEIKSLKDLIGKKIGVTSRGDTQELSVRLLLRKHGIDANSVVYIPVGFGATRLAALQAGTVDAVPLGAGDFAQLKQPKGHMLGDTEKEIRFAYVGLAVSSRLLTRQPHLVERFLRSVIKGREYARRYREQTIPILGKYTQRKREFNEFDYDSTLPVLTAEGWVADDILKEDVAMRAELVGVPAPADHGKFFDYSIAKKIYRDLKTAGWKPTP